MKLKFNGTAPVDIASHSDVRPGDVIEVADELGERLLLNGYAYPEGTDGDGNPLAPVPPADPQWQRATGKVTARTPDEPDVLPEAPAPTNTENQEN